MRETFPCPTCRASLRYRHQAEVLLAHYSTRGSASVEELCREPRFAFAAIFEPGIVGPFRTRLSSLPGYVCSGYWADVTPGDSRDGVRCEDLEALSFGDQTLDLILSSDIVEHVRHPDRAFAESFRVLRPGGAHIFTVPFLFPLVELTEPRVDVSGADDVHLAEPVHHRNPLDPDGALVYNDFGLDLVGRLEAAGFDVRLPRGLHHTLTVVATRPGRRHGG
jgi:SAM-dependent methyltransferase